MTQKKTCQTCGPSNEIEITKLKENKNKKSWRPILKTKLKDENEKKMYWEK